jgi:long-chain fatty acid transport protein
MKRFDMRRLTILLCVTGSLGTSTEILASGFQIWEQDGASIANYHAGYAALATDASIAFYNPAGITRIKHQQLAIGGSAIMTDFNYKGSVTVANTFPDPLPPLSETFPNVSDQGGSLSWVPAFHYVAPINDCIGIGLSAVVPFGLKTSYGTDTPVRYAATLSSITMANISPSIGFKVTNKASLGAGLDIQRVYAELDLIGTSILTPDSDTDSTNKANGTAYGYHLGALYEFTPVARVGLSYHSKVRHHLSGSSKFEGPIADALNGGELRSSHATTNVTFPAYTALSGYWRFHPCWAAMGTVIYTQWNVFKDLVLNDVAGAVTLPFPDIIGPSRNIQVNIPEHYRNTWNASLGLDFYPTETIIVRGGVGFDQTPARTQFRNVQLPDNNRYVFAVGGHFQATRDIGLDIGWTHVFVNKAKVNPPAQVVGAQVVNTDGNVTGGADVFGGQLTWNFC